MAVGIRRLPREQADYLQPLGIILPSVLADRIQTFVRARIPVERGRASRHNHEDNRNRHLSIVRIE